MIDDVLVAQQLAIVVPRVAELREEVVALAAAAARKAANPIQVLGRSALAAIRMVGGVGVFAVRGTVAALTPRVTTLAATIPDLTLDDLGSATLALDLGSFRHETQYSRIFRS